MDEIDLYFQNSDDKQIEMLESYIDALRHLQKENGTGIKQMYIDVFANSISPFMAIKIEMAVRYPDKPYVINKK